MKRKKSASDPLLEINDLLKKILVLELFKLGVPQSDIGKRLHMDLHAVNTLLKGIKKVIKDK